MVPLDENLLFIRSVVAVRAQLLESGAEKPFGRRGLEDVAFSHRHLAMSSNEQAANMSNTAKETMGRWKAFSAALASGSTPYVHFFFLSTIQVE